VAKQAALDGPTVALEPPKRAASRLLAKLLGPDAHVKMI